MGFGLKKLTGRVLGTVASAFGKGQQGSSEMAAQVVPPQQNTTTKPEDVKKPRKNSQGTILTGETAGPTAATLEKKTILGG